MVDVPVVLVPRPEEADDAVEEEGEEEEMVNLCKIRRSKDMGG